MNVVYLVIAQEGEYSAKNTWVVEAFTDEAVAIEKAARLNVERHLNEAVYRAYRDKFWLLQRDLGEVYLRAESPQPEHFHLSSKQQIELNAQIAIELPSVAPPEADDYTVVAIPIGEPGRWDLP